MNKRARKSPSPARRQAKARTPRAKTRAASKAARRATGRREFHHIGLPTDVSQPGEVYVADTKVWVTDPRVHPYKVEFLRFEPDSPVKGPLRDLPHVAFRVDDMDAALRGEQVILAPFSPSPGFMVAFTLRDGAVFEFMTFTSDDDLPWK